LIGMSAEVYLIEIPASPVTQVHGCSICRHATFIHGPGGTFKGADQNGNKYYERMTEIFGEQHRTPSQAAINDSPS